MWKKHHVLFLVLAGIGVVYLIYEWAKNRAGSSASSGAIDTSQLPTVISTGGGGYTPSVPSFTPQDFSNVGSQPIAATQSPAYSSVTTPGVTVMPGTSGSGVPAYSPAAQEFNTNPTLTAPSAASATPSFYQTAVAPTYNDIPQNYVANPNIAGSNTADLATYLGTSLRAAEISANNAIGNNRALGGTPGIDAPTVDQFNQQITQSSASWIAQHPEASTADNAGLVASLVNQYKTFIGTDTAYVDQQQQNSQQGTYVNPTGVAPVGTPIQVSPGVWKTPNQIAADQPTQAPASTPTAPASSVKTSPRLRRAVI